MATKSEIATALLANYCGTLRRAGFSHRDVRTAMMSGILVMDQMDTLGVTEFELMTAEDVERILASLGKLSDECECPVCEAKRAARRSRGAEHQGEEPTNL